MFCAANGAPTAAQAIGDDAWDDFDRVPLGHRKIQRSIEERISFAEDCHVLSLGEMLFQLRCRFPIDGIVGELSAERHADRNFGFSSVKCSATICRARLSPVSGAG